MGSAFLQRQAWPNFLLRIGLAFVFLYAAISSFINPQDWVGFLPHFLAPHGLVLLKTFSVAEILLAAWLLSGIYACWAGLVSAAFLAGITFSNFSLFAISFRDIGLIFAALALAALPEATDEQ